MQHRDLYTPSGEQQHQHRCSADKTHVLLFLLVVCFVFDVVLAVEAVCVCVLCILLAVSQ